MDACFFIGLYDTRDQYHGVARRQFENLFGDKSARNVLVAPWPILYESLGTRQARNTASTNLVRRDLTYLKVNRQLLLLDDSAFRQKALDSHTDDARTLSLVDRVLRGMIEQEISLFDALLTYNTKDFIDACQVRRMTLLNEKFDETQYASYSI